MIFLLHFQVVRALWERVTFQLLLQHIGSICVPKASPWAHTSSCCDTADKTHMHLSYSRSVHARGCEPDRRCILGTITSWERDLGTGALKPGKQSFKIITKGSTSSHSRWQTCGTCYSQRLEQARKRK